MTDFGGTTERLVRRTERPDDTRRVAVALIGRGLDLQPGNPWGMAHDIAQALGLVPTVPASEPRRRGDSGWAYTRKKARS